MRIAVPSDSRLAPPRGNHDFAAVTRTPSADAEFLKAVARLELIQRFGKAKDENSTHEPGSSGRKSAQTEFGKKSEPAYVSGYNSRVQGANFGSVRNPSEVV
jgi:hypothetical protein